jgi:hypothetical protein
LELTVSKNKLLFSINRLINQFVIENQVRSTITTADNILFGGIRFLLEFIKIEEIFLPIPLILIGVTILVTLGV